MTYENAGTDAAPGEGNSRPAGHTKIITPMVWALIGGLALSLIALAITYGILMGTQSRLDAANKDLSEAQAVAETSQEAASRGNAAVFMKLNDLGFGYYGEDDIGQYVNEYAGLCLADVAHDEMQLLADNEFGDKVQRSFQGSPFSGSDTMDAMRFVVGTYCPHRSAMLESALSQ